MTDAQTALLKLLEQDCKQFLNLMEEETNDEWINRLTVNIGNLRADLIRISAGELLLPGALEFATLKHMDYIAGFLYEMTPGELKRK